MQTNNEYMNNVYLDTSHLIKWSKKKLETSVLQKLEKMACAPNYRFVVSRFHIPEIARYKEQEKSVKIVKFIYDLPSIGILAETELFQWEISNAYRIYTGKKATISPFLIAQPELFSEEDFLKRLPSYVEQQNAYEKAAQKTIKFYKEMHTSSKNDSPENFRKNINKTFQLRIKNEIEKMEISSHDKSEFLKFIISNSNLIPSLTINFYMCMYSCRNLANSITISDQIDIDHLSAIPYVTHFSLDKKCYNRLNAAIKWTSLELKTKINNNLSELFINI